MKNNILETIKKAVNIEAESIKTLYSKIDDNFVEAVNIIKNCKGRVILLGVGKSGLIGKKISSTLSSIGVPSFFIHPTDAAHGDLGMITKDDVALLLSNSGKTEELLFILPLLKRFGVPIISIVGNINSELAERSDIALDGSVKEEASSISLVPMASTTVALVIGDALAAGLIVKNDFREDDFAMLHPGGTIGKKLLLRTEDLMHKSEDIPFVDEKSDFNSVVYEISSKRLGVAVVARDKEHLVGIVTDGDLRRSIEKYSDKIFTLKAEDIMTRNPKTIDKNALAAKAANIMEQYSITSIVVVNKNSKIEGIIHLHDILKAGIL